MKTYMNEILEVGNIKKLPMNIFCYLHTLTHMHTRTYAHTHTHARTHTHIRTHTHTIYSHMHL